ncbi:MAG TPA: PilX N-terminal domain-containing pilus assembly protein [Casimicrobiaceae bacterium]
MHPAVCLREQRGVALVMSVLMLVLLTLLVLAVINMSTVNLRVAHNEQTKTESIAAAQRAIEQVASANFPADPQPVTVAVDINNDGRSDYSVAVAKPECKNAVPIKVVELDIAQPSDVACFTSSAVGSAGSTGNSVCANTQWDIAAKTTDAANSGATVTVHQGIGQRVPIDTTC